MSSAAERADESLWESHPQSFDLLLVEILSAAALHKKTI